MKELIVLMLSFMFITSCGSCGGDELTDLELQQLKAAADSSAVQEEEISVIDLTSEYKVDKLALKTIVYSDDGSTFYPKEVQFFMENGVFRVKTERSQIDYEIISEVMNTSEATSFSAFTSLSEWYSDPSIERVSVSIHVDEEGMPYSVLLNNRMFYSKIPPLPKTYTVKKGDHLSKLVKDLGLSEECIRSQIGIPDVGETIDLNYCSQ
jgi:hypothetical protein